MKKISISKIDECIKANVKEAEVEWNGLTLVVKNRISYKEMKSIVDKVIESCFKKDGTYMPENKDACIREMTISIYSNASIPEDDEHKYEIAYSSGLYEAIVCNIDKSQYDEIINAINCKIDNLAQANVQYIYKQMNDISNSVKSITDSLNDAFGGIGKDDVSKLMSAVSNGKLDEEKIVKAYMKNKKVK